MANPPEDKYPPAPEWFLRELDRRQGRTASIEERLANAERRIAELEQERRYFMVYKPQEPARCYPVYTPLQMG